MRRLILMIVVGVLFGCSSASPPATLVATPPLERDADMAMVGNWTVKCLQDHAKAQTNCFAGTFGESDIYAKFFQIRYVNRSGPYLFVPHDFPGRVPTVRVDDGPVLRDPTSIVAALKKGKTAYVVFHTWPDGEHRMTVDLTGFSDAYGRLLERVRNAPPA